MVHGAQVRLHVHAHAKGLGIADHNPDFSPIHGVGHSLATVSARGSVHDGDFLAGNTASHEIINDGLGKIETAFLEAALHEDHLSCFRMFSVMRQ